MRNLTRFLLLSFWLAGGVAGLSRGAWAQAAGAKPSVEERMAALEQRFERLEQRLDAVLERLASGEAEEDVSGLAMLRPMAAVERKLQMVESRARQGELVAAKSVASKRDTVMANDAPKGILAGAGREGFFLRSEDGGFALKLRGTIQADGRFLAGAAPRGGSTFSASKVRPTLEGVLFKNFGFKFMPDFGGGTTVIQEAYFEAAIRPWLKLRAGKMKGPVGLERLVADTDVEFFERALPTNLAPNRDVGVELYGEPWGGVASYAAGIFNGVADGSSGDFDSDNRREFEGRWLLRPFRKNGAAAMREFGVGIAGSYGRKSGDALSSEVAAYKTTGQQSFFRYRNDGTTAGTAVADGEHYRWSPQANYYAGPVGLWGEYALSRQQVRRGALRAQIGNAAWQAGGTIVLTGEKASYYGVTPARAFEGGQGSWGAFEIAARYSELRADREAFPWFADPQNAVQTARAWALGLNWYLNRNVKLLLNYERTTFEQAAGGANRKAENAVVERFQVAF